MSAIRHNAIVRRHPRSHHRARHEVGIEGVEGIRAGDSISVSSACDAWLKRNHLALEPSAFTKADNRRAS